MVALSDLVIGLEVAGSLLIILFLGFLLGYLSYLDSQALSVIVFYVSRVALPASLFFGIAPFAFEERAIPTILTVLFATILVIFLILPICILLRFSLGGIGLAIFSVTSGNVIVLTAPIIEVLFPEDPFYINQFVIYTLYPSLVLMLPLSIFLFSLDQDRRNGNGVSSVVVNRALFSVITNPNVIAMFLGTLFAIIPLPVVSVFSFTLQSLAGTTSPLGVFSVGLAISTINLRQLLESLFGLPLVYLFFKMFLLPILALPWVVVFGMSSTDVRVLVLYLSAPTAIASFVLAHSFSIGKGEERDHTMIVAVSLALQTVVFFVVILLFTVILNAFGWFVD
ncbi:hypothetical protein P9112_008928 [Eukaryota sp. TZLM1-RC]